MMEHKMKGQIQESKDEKSIYIDINFYDILLKNKNAIKKIKKY